MNILIINQCVVDAGASFFTLLLASGWYFRGCFAWLCFLAERLWPQTWPIFVLDPIWFSRRSRCCRPLSRWTGPGCHAPARTISSSVVRSNKPPPHRYGNVPDWDDTPAFALTH